MNKYLSIITINLNGLYASSKRHRVVEWKRKYGQHICSLQETHLRTKDPHRPTNEELAKKYSKQLDRKKKSWGSNYYMWQIAAAIQGHLQIHINFWIVCSMSVKYAIVTLICIALNLLIALGSMDILMMLTLPIHKHGICFH